MPLAIAIEEVSDGVALLLQPQAEKYIIVPVKNQFAHLGASTVSASVTQ